MNVLVATRTGHNLVNLKHKFETEAMIEPFSYPAFENIAPGMAQLLKPMSSVIYPNIIGLQSQLNCNNPMLRTFLHILGGNNAIDCSHGRVSLGEIFNKLVCNIYKCHYLTGHVANRIGKLAFQALINPDMMSQDIPNDDPMLVDNTHNYVRFKQSTMQIYLAALHFVLEIDAGKSASSLFGDNCADPLLMTNYLFLYFTLCFTRQTTGNVVSADQQRVYQAIVLYVKDQIDFLQLDMIDVTVRYPALDVSFAKGHDDNFVLEFVKDVIAACTNTKMFVAAPDHPIEEILSTTEPIFPKLSVIGLIDRENRKDSQKVGSSLKLPGEEDGSEIDVVLSFSISTLSKVKWILKVAQSLGRPISLRLIDIFPAGKKPTIDISSLIKENVKMFCCYQSCFLFSGQGIARCEYLTHLVFTGHGKEIHQNTFTALCKAIGDAQLPKLSHLGFSGCGSSLEGKMQYLFEKPWPMLTHLDVTKCILDEQDVRIICAAADDSMQNLLPKLASLAISPKYLDVDEKLKFLKKPWHDLKSLEMLGRVKDYPRSKPEETQEYPAYTAFINGLSDGMFPNLERLGTSECFPKQLKELKSLRSLILNKGRTKFDEKLLDVKQLSEEFPVFKLEQIELSHSRLLSNLAHLVSHRFPHLESLSQRSCGLPSDSGESLAQANASGRLQKLKQLDLRGNACTSVDLFVIKCPWKELQILRTSENFQSWPKTCQKIAEMIKSGHLPKLVEIHVQEYEDYNDEYECPTCGLPPEHVLRDRVRRVYVSSRNTRPQVTPKVLLGSIVENLPRLKPSLFEAIYFYSGHFFSYNCEDIEAGKQEIRSKNIMIDFIKQW